MDIKLQEFDQSEKRVLKHFLDMSPTRECTPPPPPLCEGLFSCEDCEGLIEELQRSAAEERLSSKDSTLLCVRCTNRSAHRAIDLDRTEIDAPKEDAAQVPDDVPLEYTLPTCGDKKHIVSNQENVEGDDVGQQLPTTGDTAAPKNGSLQYVLNGPLVESTGGEMKSFTTVHGEGYGQDLSIRPGTNESGMGGHDHDAALAGRGATLETKEWQSSPVALEVYSPPCIASKDPQDVTINADEPRATSFRDIEDDTLLSDNPKDAHSEQDQKAVAGTSKYNEGQNIPGRKQDKPTRRSKRIKERGSSLPA